MGKITQIDIRPDILLEVLSMGVLHCRQEMNRLADDAAAVSDDADEYRRLIRVMGIALDVLESVRDFNSFEFVRISGSGEVYDDGATLVWREEIDGTDC